MARKTRRNRKNRGGSRKRRRTNRRSRKSKRSNKRSSKRSSKRSNKRSSKRSQRGGKRKINEFFKLMLNAKKHHKQEFRYKGKRYKAMKTKTGMTVYKKA